MVLPQRARSDEFGLVPLEVAQAAQRYQRLKEIEQQHLALMARHNLLEDWTTDVRETVLQARERIREARDARDAFRVQVRDFVLTLRGARETLPAVLRHTRSMLEMLERSGAIQADGGWLEAEVLEWAIEEYEG